MKMAAAQNGHNDDVVHEIKGMIDLYNPGCCLAKSVKEGTDQFSKATDLDNKRKNLIKTYLDFNRDLWPGSQNNENTISQGEQVIRDKLEEFKNAWKEYAKDISDGNQNHCFLYREFEINGVSRKSTKKGKFAEIRSAFTDIITFPSYEVSLKTAKVKQGEKNARLETTTKSWKEATQDYLDRYYPEDGVFRVPPALEYEDELILTSGKKPVTVKDNLLRPDEKGVEEGIPDDMKTRYKKKIEGFFDRRRGVKAESEMLIAFEKWGRHTKQNMFIFGGYKYSNYLKNVANLERITTEQGEFDMLILSQQLGIIFVEVKGSVGAKHLAEASGGHKPDVEGEVYLSGKYGKEKTKSYSIQSEIQDGWRQLMKANFVFREMNRDLSFVRKLPFKGFIGVPFLSLSDSNDAHICSDHCKLVIHSEDLSQLEVWLRENHFPEGYAKQAMSREQFRELAARFVGLASAVTTEIDTIKFTNRKMMCTFSTPQQTEILRREEKHAILFGDFGTGKTFVLTRKATSIVSPSGRPPSKSREKKQASFVPEESTVSVVHIVPCADLSNFKKCYGVTFSDQVKDITKFVKPVDKENKSIQIYTSFLDFYTKVTGSKPDPNVEVGIDLVIDAVRETLHGDGQNNVTGKEHQNSDSGESNGKTDITSERVTDEKVQKRNVIHHFFFDEFPVHPLTDGAFNRLRKFFLDPGNGLKDSFLWINVATHSLGVSSEKNPSKLLRKQLSIENEEDVFYCYLTDVMRISKEIYNMIKKIEQFIDKGHFEYSRLGHMLNGIKPRLYRQPPRKCESLENDPLDCECQVANLASTLRRILESVVDDREPVVVTILIYYVMSSLMFERVRTLLSRVAQILNINLTWNTMQSRYTKENTTEFADGLDRGIDAIEISPTMINGTGFKQSVKDPRSPCPARNDEASEKKKPLASEWKIQVVDQRTFAGCETPLLIFIDPFGMRHWYKRGTGQGSGYHSLIFTRCTGHFILITWPDDEAEKMWHMHLDEYEAEIRESVASEHYKQSRYKYLKTGREATENCLQMLLDEDLIVNMNMERT